MIAKMLHVRTMPPALMDIWITPANVHVPTMEDIVKLVCTYKIILIYFHVLIIFDILFRYLNFKTTNFVFLKDICSLRVVNAVI